MERQSLAFVGSPYTHQYASELPAGSVGESIGLPE